MKCLPAPYGYRDGDYITMTTDREPTEGLREVLEAFSCYPPSIPRIIDCLTHSGRYDCVVQPGWFRHQYGTLKRELASVGVSVVYTRLCEYDAAKINEAVQEDYMEWYRTNIKPRISR